MYMCDPLTTWCIYRPCMIYLVRSLRAIENDFYSMF